MLPFVGSLMAAEESIHWPGIGDFLPPEIFWGLNRIHLIEIAVVLFLLTIFGLYASRAKLIPGRAQTTMELGFDFIYNNICEPIIGRTLGRRYMPVIVTIFFTVLFMNLTGIIPGMNIAGSSRAAVPAALAVLAYVTYVGAGIKNLGAGKYITSQIFPPNVPWPVYLILTPIEIFSIFVVRPATLVIRLLSNMIAGHMLLALCYVATEYLIFVQGEVFLKPLGALTFVSAIVVTLFETFVAALQAYIFAVLTAVYINLSVHAH